MCLCLRVVRDRIVVIADKLTPVHMDLLWECATNSHEIYSAAVLEMLRKVSLVSAIISFSESCVGV